MKTNEKTTVQPLSVGADNEQSPHSTNDSVTLTIEDVNKDFGNQRKGLML